MLAGVVIIPSPVAGEPDPMPWWSVWVLGGIGVVTFVLVAVCAWVMVRDWIRRGR